MMGFTDKKTARFTVEFRHSGAFVTKQISKFIDPAKLGSGPQAQTIQKLMEVICYR